MTFRCLSHNMSTPAHDLLPKDLLAQRTRQLQTLVRVAELINIVDLDFVLAQTMQLTTEVSGASKGSFFLLDENLQPIQRFITQRNMPPEMSRQVAREVVEKGLAGWCVRHRKGAAVEDVSQDERWYVFADDKQDDVRSALCMPVIFEDQIHGVMTLVSPTVGHFSAADLQLVNAIAIQASTAIRNAQLVDALQSKQQELELVLNNTSDALIMTDPTFKIRLCNPRAVSLLGKSSVAELLGQSLSVAAQGSVFSSVVQRITTTPPDKSPTTLEVEANQEQKDYAVSSAALDEGGYIIVIHDVTQLKEFDHLKTNMLHMLTHDLKNPLNVAWGYVDLLRIDGQQGKIADSRFVDGILRALQRMENLIEETLSVARLMNTGASHTDERFAPHKVIGEALDACSDQIHAKNHRIIQDIQANLPELIGSRFQIREAMVNLLNNAIKYTSENGAITVRAYQENKRFIFAVIDTGMGIPIGLQKNLFDKFYRADRPATRDIEGTGLGLNLVKNVIEQHRGTVWFESEEGKGSTFGFWLPLPQ